MGIEYRRAPNKGSTTVALVSCPYCGHEWAEHESTIREQLPCAETPPTDGFEEEESQQ